MHYFLPWISQVSAYTHWKYYLVMAYQTDTHTEVNTEKERIDKMLAEIC
jgi:hypothetical protein